MHNSELAENIQSSIIKTTSDEWMDISIFEHVDLETLKIDARILALYKKTRTIVEKRFINDVIPGYAILLSNLSVIKETGIPIPLHARKVGKLLVNKVNKKSEFHEILRKAILKIQAISYQPEILLISKNQLILRYFKYYKTYLDDFEVTEEEIVNWIKIVNATIVQKIGAAMTQENLDDYIVQNFHRVHKNY